MGFHHLISSLCCVVLRKVTRGGIIEKGNRSTVVWFVDKNKEIPSPVAMSHTSMCRTGCEKRRRGLGKVLDSRCWWCDPNDAVGYTIFGAWRGLLLFQQKIKKMVPEIKSKCRKCQSVGGMAALRAAPSFVFIFLGTSSNGTYLQLFSLQTPFSRAPPFCTSLVSCTPTMWLAVNDTRPSAAALVG